MRSSPGKGRFYPRPNPAISSPSCAMCPGTRWSWGTVRGRRFRARLAGREEERAVLDLIEELSAPAQRLPAMTLAQAILKGKRMDLLVEKAVELGARRIVPVLTSRTVVRLDDRFSQKRGRWLRKAAGAVKQSGCAGPTELAEPMTFEEVLATVGGYDLACLAALSPDAQPLAHVLRRAGDLSSLLFIVGPGGDFTPAELELARCSAGCRFVSLAPHVLRGETAALVALAGALDAPAQGRTMAFL